MRKRAMRLIIFLFLLLAGVSGYGEELDVVVLVDVTWSLQESYDEIEEYLLGALLKDVLKDGDTFHLLWFSDRVETMIQGRVTDRRSREEFRAGLAGLRNLRWTFGRYTDLVGAVAALIRFTDRLAPDRKKLIILVTDGIHDPPPGTVARADDEELKSVFLKQAEEIKNRGWSIHLLRTPSGETAAATSAPFFDTFRDAGDDQAVKLTDGNKEDLLSETAGLPRIVFPESLGRVGRRTVVPLVVINPGAKAISLRLTAVRWGERDLLERPAAVEAWAKGSGALNAPVVFPDDLGEGEQTLPLTLVFQDDPRLVGTTGTVRLDYRKSLPPPLWEGNRNVNLGIVILPLWAILVLAVVLLLLLLLLLLLAAHLIRRRGFHFSMRRVLGADALMRRAKHRPLEDTRETPRHSFAVEMTVSQQRRHIGHRNIHTIRRNRALSVGGGRSNFLIFLVPVPRQIAKIYYDGERFTFRPVKYEFFPDLKDEIPDCLDKAINALSKRCYPLELCFRRYVSPLEELTIIFNRLKEKSESPG